MREPYWKYLQSAHWLSFRVAVLTNRSTCEICWTSASEQVHHLNYDNLGHELGSDVLALCRPCHAGQHGKWGEIIGIGGDALVERVVRAALHYTLYTKARHCWMCGGRWEQPEGKDYWQMVHTPECSRA